MYGSSLRVCAMFLAVLAVLVLGLRLDLGVDLGVGLGLSLGVRGGLGVGGLLLLVGGGRRLGVMTLGGLAVVDRDGAGDGHGLDREGGAALRLRGPRGALFVPGSAGLAPTRANHVARRRLRHPTVQLPRPSRTRALPVSPAIWPSSADTQAPLETRLCRLIMIFGS